MRKSTFEVAIPARLAAGRDGETQSLQLTAAKTILELGLKAVELADIEERLATLETIAKNRGWRGAGNEQPIAPPGKGVNGHA
jgi:hypothetical protein